MSGLQQGEMIIIAARPSMGKCLAAQEEIVLEDGSIATIEELYHRRGGPYNTRQRLQARVDHAERLHR